MTEKRYTGQAERKLQNLKALRHTALVAWSFVVLPFFFCCFHTQGSEGPHMARAASGDASDAASEAGFEDASEA